MQADGNGKQEKPTDPFGEPEQELELSYPCSWSYTVIGEEDVEVRAVIASAVGDLDHTVSFSHESKGGKYRSYKLEVVVPTNRERLRIFRELHESERVRYLF